MHYDGTKIHLSCTQKTLNQKTVLNLMCSPTVRSEDMKTKEQIKLILEHIF